MAIQLINNGTNIKYVNGSLIRNILKIHIHEVSLVRGTIIKIALGQGTLNHIFIDQTKVEIPVSSSAGNLRDQLLAMVQGEDIPLLINLEAHFASIDSKVFPQPTIQDYTTPNTAYYGFAVVGQSDTSQAIWAIQRTISIDGVSTGLWAGGTNAFDKVWDNRADYTYS